MARDAISRQFDVDKNSVILFCEPGPGDYRPGTITFFAKKGRSIDLQQIRASITATRLSGNTGMKVDSLLVTVAGDIQVTEKEVLQKVPGSTQVFVLIDDPSIKPKQGDRTPLGNLREAVTRGQKVASVTGYVQGWSGGFPVVLRALAAEAAKGKPSVLIVTEFEVEKK